VLGEERLDLGPEIDHPAVPESAHRHRDFEFSGRVSDADDGSPVAGRSDVTLRVDGRDGRIRTGVGGFAGNVAVAVGHEELPAGKGVPDFDRGDGTGDGGPAHSGERAAQHQGGDCAEGRP
jgi:hypothetical protein